MIGALSSHAPRQFRRGRFAGKNKRRSLQQLLEQESPRRVKIPYDPKKGFGFNLRGTTVGGGESRGQYIRSVDFSGAAHQWGLKAGDRILAVNSIVCENESHESVLKLIKGAPGSSREQIELLVVADTQVGHRHPDPVVPPPPPPPPPPLLACLLLVTIVMMSVPPSLYQLYYHCRHLHAPHHHRRHHHHHAQMGKHAMKATKSMLADERKSAIHPETGM